MSNIQEPERLGQILAIEPDPESGAALRRTLASQIRAELVIVGSIEDALGAISERVPDLILTSTFLSPADEHRICEHLKARAEALHTQVLALPQFIDTGNGDQRDISEHGRAVVLRFRPKRSPDEFPRCDGNVVRELVNVYLDQARSSKRRRADAPTISAHPGVAPSVDAGHNLPAYVLPQDRRRAPRLRASDLGGQWGLRILAAGNAQIVDISRLGVLLETRSKLMPGATLDLHLIGVEQHFSVAARLVRSDSVPAGDHDVTYRVAAAFAHEIDILTPKAPSKVREVIHPPRVLGDLLGRVLADANWVTNGANLRAKFEEEVAALVRGQRVRIGAATLRPPAGCRTASFRVPGSKNAQLRLRVVFERGHEPTRTELRLLRAAANLAAVVLELAPSSRLHSPTI